MGIFDWFGRAASGGGAVSGEVDAVVVRPAATGHGSYEIPREVVAEGGLAVMQLLLEDDDLEEIMHNGSEQPLVVYHRTHGMCRVNHVLSVADCQAFIREVATDHGATIDETKPLFDGTLRDGSRINIALPPVSYKYPSMTIRKFRSSIITMSDIIRGNGLSPEAGAFLWCAVEGFGTSAANLLCVGGTGSGKTTMLNALLQFTPPRDRIVVIEDTRELKVSDAQSVRMTTTETATMDRLLINTLRMRPDRILVGEVRGPEARTLFNAMNTGHDGCMGTLHANSARESLNRITSPPMSVPLTQVVGLDLIVVQELRHLPSGSHRACMEISEISGFNADQARLNQLYRWDEFKKRLEPTGVPSRLRTKICRAAGMRATDFEAVLRRRAMLLAQLARNGVSGDAFTQAVQAEMAG